MNEIKIFPTTPKERIRFNWLLLSYWAMISAKSAYTHDWLWLGLGLFFSIFELIDIHFNRKLVALLEDNDER